MSRAEDVIEHVLRDAAAVLIRSGSRPTWLPRGYPTQLILTKKRHQLIERVVADPPLRTQLRTRSRHYIGIDIVADAQAATFDAGMRASADPHRYVAGGLIHPDEAVAAAASPWALAPQTIPLAEPTLAPRLDTVEAQPDCDDDGADASQLGSNAADAAAGVSGGSDLRATIDDTGTLPPDLTGSRADASDASSLHEIADLHAQLAAVAAERDQLRADVTRLDAVAIELRSQIPTRGDRKRQNKQQAELRRVSREATSQAEELAALRTERDQLLHAQRELENELEEAQEARAVAIRKSQNLERQLATTEGRADYLRRAVDKDVTALRAQIEQKKLGPERTALVKRADALADVVVAIDVAFQRRCDSDEEEPRRRAVTRSLEVTVTPIGGGAEIGGSAILVEAGDRRVLVDAGLHPDGRGPLDIDEVFAGGRLDAVVVTHAHNDHAGYVPALVARFPTLPVYCSTATAQLLPTMWNDSANVMARSFEEAADSSAVRLPLYGKPEVEVAEDHIQDRPFNRAFPVGDLRLTLFPAGHILGAAGVVIEAGDKRVVITGDISGIEDEYFSVDSTHLPEGLVAGADLLVIETTYCGEDRTLSRAAQEEALCSTVSSVVARRGRVLIPAFGLGRAQEVVMILNRRMPELNILVDGLAREISIVYETFGEVAGRPLPIFGDRVRAVANRVRERQSFHSGVVVASSGMLTGGASVFWAEDILRDERAALLLCGYQDEDAPGRQLEQLIAGGGPKVLRLPNQETGEFEHIEVRAQVEKYALSAHADRGALIDIIERVRPRETMLVHGLPDRQRAFAQNLRDRRIATVPTARWSSCPT